MSYKNFRERHPNVASGVAVCGLAVAAIVITPMTNSDAAGGNVTTSVATSCSSQNNVVLTATVNNGLRTSITDVQAFYKNLDSPSVDSLGSGDSTSLVIDTGKSSVGDDTVNVEYTTEDDGTIDKFPTFSAKDCKPPAAPTVTLGANPASITLGESTKLTWSTTGNPDSLKASGDWSGNKNVSGGNETVTPTEARTYTFTLTPSSSSGGPGKAQTVTVTVKDKPTQPPTTVPPTSQPPTVIPPTSAPVTPPTKAPTTGSKPTVQPSTGASSTPGKKRHRKDSDSPVANNTAAPSAPAHTGQSQAPLIAVIISAFGALGLAVIKRRQLSSIFHIGRHR